jgi:hypothetical protein
MNPKELRDLVKAYTKVYAPEEEIEEEMKPLPKEKMDRQAMKAYKKERSAIDRRDDPEANRQMQRRIAMQSPASRRNVLDNKKMREEVEIDEAVKGADPEMRKASAAERRSGDKPLSKKRGDETAAFMARKIKMADKLSKAKDHMPGYTYGEEVENLDFDSVLELLQNEGHSYEEAIKIMVSIV